ncbi:DUF7018 domain-containing (lipo)protein [Bacillus cereus]|uniref:DUF7018 domain-containing (lipo)protein n=1 Tax=Bacillus cereus TaxID=1396 RepID=UPI00384E0B26
MKRKILSLVVPLFLVTEVGCGLSDKSPESKTEAVSKTTMKVALSEEQYPYYICEQVIEYQLKKDEFLINMSEAFKDKNKLDDVSDSVDELEEIVNAIENIEAPSKYKTNQKVMLEGTSELRKGIDLIKESRQKDKTNINKPIANLVENVKAAYLDYWEPTINEISKENPDAYKKTLEKKLH